jgi:hypothetical protein
VDTVAPRVSLLSPVAMDFDAANVPLDFTVDERFSRLTYSLDGNDNVTVAGNVTLHGLANGDHDIRVYAWDEAGNVGASEPVTFTIATFPTTIVVASTLLAVIIGVVLLVYFKKQRNKEI